MFARGTWMVVAIVALCVGIEIVLSLGDVGVFGRPRFRAVAYEFAGFWPGLLDDWQPNYAAQPYLMFITYGFLHGGLAHLAVNMITLWSLGQPVLERVGTWGFVSLYGASLIGGGLGFGLLANNTLPMVGASGALFGVFGGLLSWSYVDRYSFNEALWPVLRAIFALVLLNLVMWWAMDGQLAWQTHLGGFLTGWVVALLIDPRARD